MQHAYKVDMNEAGKQQAGEAFVIRQRHTAKIKVQQIEPLPPVAPQEPERRTVEEAPPTEKKSARQKSSLQLSIFLRTVDEIDCRGDVRYSW